MSAVESQTRIENEFSNVMLSFCPDILIKHLDETALLGDVSPSRSWYQDGACMLVDISGFTRLSGELCAEGDRGLDKLRQITSVYLSTLLHIVYSNGGDVIAFAGDALVCVFMNGRVNCCEDDSTVAEESARKAVACGFELKDLSYDKKLMCHIAVSYGRMCCGVLEGSAGVRSFLLNGECIHNLSSCIDDAKSSELVICKLTKQYANQFITLSTELESTNFRIEQVAGVDTSDMTSVVCFLKRYQNKLQNLKLRHFADFVPQNVIDSYHSGSFHIFGELREVTTVFIKIDTYAYHSCSDLMLLEGYFNMATKALKEEGGYLRQFIVDDKGCVLIALWGTPNTSYDSNSERALNFAARVLEGSRPLGHSCSAGISAGTVYYGSIGSVLRRDIVAMGSSVNLAARLMSKANGRIIMCPDVFEGLSIDHRQRMHQIEPMQLKGYSDPIVPYALKADYMTYALLQYGALSPEKCYLAKRDAMVQSNLDPDIVSYMAATLEKVENNYMVVKELWMTMADKMNTSNNCLASSEEYNQICRVGRYDVEVIVIEGEKCCGKSEIARKFQTLAENHKLRTYTVIVEESDSTVPYSTLVKVFLALLNCSTADKDHKEGVMKRLLCTTFPQVEKNDVLLNEYFDQLSLIVQSASSASANILDLNSVCACPLRMRLYSCVGTDEVLMSVIVSLMELVPTALIVENFHFSDLVSKSKLMSVRKLKVPAAILFTQRTFSLDEGFADDDQGPNRKCQCGPVCVCQYKTRFNRYGKVFASAHVHIQETITPSKPQKKLMHVRRFKLGPLSLQQVWKVTDLVINSDGGKRMSEADFDKLVTVIRSLSEGNPHWVYAYAKFAKGQNGQIVEELQNLISDDGSTSSWARTSSSSRSPSPTQTSADSPPMIGKKSYLKKHVLGVMNSLTAIQSTALKFASVLGYEFSSELLSAFLPPQSQDSLNHTLSLLETLMLIQRSTFTDLISFRFVTPQVRQIVYDLVPPSDMKILHEKAARICVTIGNIAPSITAYHFFMAYSGPCGDSVQKETSVYALKAALEETALLRFTYAMEYFSIAELTVGDEISSVCHLLNCVRDVLSLFERLEAENKKSIFMFIKDAQHIVFGNITRKFKNMLSIEMPLERISSLSSVSTYSDISSSDADIVEEYALMKCRLEKKFDSLVCKQGECDELCEVCEYTAPVFKTKPVACCTIS